MKFAGVIVSQLVVSLLAAVAVYNFFSLDAGAQMSMAVQCEVYTREKINGSIDVRYIVSSSKIGEDQIVLGFFDQTGLPRDAVCYFDQDGFRDMTLVSFGMGY